MLNKKIENLTVKILSSLFISNVKEIDLESICRANNIILKKEKLENDISGLLVLKNSSTYILCNELDNNLRQRFTIAHELGHFYLHKDSNIFVDTQKVLYRNADSSRGEIKREIEANSFAAALLMPENFVLNEIDKLNKSYLDIEDIDILAKIFSVSTLAMSFRLSNLGFQF